MRVRDFDFDLPPELIAQAPLARRDDSRLMVIHRTNGRIEHDVFRNFPGTIDRGDLIVFNDTKVIPAKVWGKCGEATIEFLFLEEREAGLWEVLCKPARRTKTGDTIVFAGDWRAVVMEEGGEGRRLLRFSVPDVLGRLHEIGFAPLPPYIKRKRADPAARPGDLERYQTIFADREGAIAAPTAGLHFTPDILDRVRSKGAATAWVTLHVGLATFQPMRADRLEDHKMLEESYDVNRDAAAAVNRRKDEKGIVLAVGTTVVRTLESAGCSGRVQAGPGTTSLFIHPGYEFKIIDRLLTNFHLPQSTLLMLVSALAGRDLILQAYREAIRERYRFFSYGDCMLIL